MHRTSLFVVVAAVCFGALWWGQRERASNAPRLPVPADSTPAATRPPATVVEATRPAASPLAPLPQLQPDESPAFSAFQNWLGASAAAEAGRSRPEGGVALARERRAALAELIRTNPQRALELAVPAAWRWQLPEEITRLLEERVSGRGSLGVLIADDFDRGTREVRREVVVNGRTYEAFVYGRRAALSTRSSLVLHGIAIDGALAVAENPVRPLEPGERLPAVADQQLCPVSARPANFRAMPAYAEVGGRVESFCGPSHITLLDDRLAADEGGSGGELPPTARDSWSQGPKTCLFMRVAFPDDPTEPITEDGAYTLMDNVNQWFVENSYDTASIISTITPLLMLAQTKAWYSVQGTSRLLADARDAARAVGLDTDNYDWDIVRHGSVPGFNYGGLGYVRGKGTWLQSSSVGVAVHELGHNYGLWHANSWTAAGDSVIGPGTHVEYGNSFDTMGAASAGNNQFNVAFKNQLDWLPESFVQTVTGNGTYRIYAYDVPSLAPGVNYALKVKKNYDRNYWAEFRQKFTSNRWLTSGVLLNWDPWNNGVSGSASGTHLLDATPGTPDGKTDGAVVIGRTFSDVGASLHLTPLAKGSTAQGTWIDVRVNLGEFITNLPPAASVSADRTAAGTNVMVNFIAGASDPNGDALAYHWDFADGTFGPNAPTAAKSWSAPGEYTVRCTVSDMKGGVFSRQVVITVGAPATFRASGRIRTAEGAPIEGVRVHNGLSGAAYRGTYTDSDGEYVLANLAAGTFTLAAAKYGYSFAANGWSTMLTLGPSANGLDWTASADPRVSLVATDANAAEAGLNPGQFLLTRAGPTNVSLTVKFNRTGAAALNSDYTNNVEFTGSPLQITLAPGITALPITVNPVPDSLAEGPEALTLTLIEDAAYVFGGPAEATVTIADDDPPSSPTVSVSATSPGALADNLAPESGTDSGVFTFTRTGGTAGELTILYSISGTATPGEDYSPLGGVVTIPVGQTSTVVPFQAIDDVEIENIESVIVTLLASAAYSISGAGATINITDDDPPTVTVTATDNTGREAGASTGVFTVTRQGSLAANLLVNYALAGTATNGADFTSLPGSVTLLAGRATANITVTPINDAVLEGDETVVLILTSSPAYNIGDPGSATITLADDELPTVNLTVTDATANETAGDTGRFTFTRTGSATNELTARFAITGTALNGLDYAPIAGSIVFAIGVTNVTLTVTPVDDAVREADESVRLSLLPDPAYNPGSTSPQTVTIKDNDTGLPGVGFTFAESSGPENRTVAYLSVSLGTNSASTVTVNYSVSGGSAAGGGVDYTLNSGRLTFAAGTVNQSISFSLNNDGVAETNETIVVTLNSPTNAVLDAQAAHTFTILDDDDSGTVSISAVDAGASETGPDPGRFRVSRNGGTTNAATVFFEVIGGASSPGDFLPVGTSVVIPSGSNAVDIVILPVDDATAETNEAVTITLTPSPRLKFGTDTATVIITDNDSATNLPIVTVLAFDPLAAEPGSDIGAFTVARDRGTNEALTVRFTVGGSATSGSDFNAIGTNVVIPVGAFAATMLVTPRDDATFETNETVVLTLTALGTYRVGSAASDFVTILDNEVGVTVAATGSSLEDGSSTGTFLFTRTGATNANLTVSFTLAGTAVRSNDYALASNFVVIPAGENSIALPVPALNDAAPEGIETVVLTLASGAGYTVNSPSNATVLILDDEPAVSVTANGDTAYEGGAQGVFVFSRTGNTNAALTIHFSVSGSASNGVDYAAIAGPVTLNPGETSAQVAVTPIDDADTEGNETIQLTLLTNAAYAVTAPGSAVLTLVDDEVNLLPTVSINSPEGPVVYLAGTHSMLLLFATAMDDGRPNPPGALTLTWSVEGGAGPVTFGDEHAANTTALFASNGTYVLRLLASDGQLAAFAELPVVVGADQFLSTGLEAHWRLDEAGGTNATDSSTNARHGTVSGPVFTSAQFGNGLSFDGEDDLVSFVSPGLTQLTFTAWIRSDAQGDSTTPRVIAMPGYNVRLRRDTLSVAFESERSTTPGEWRTPPDAFADGPWFHVAVVYDSRNAANVPEFYLNGQAQIPTTRTAPAGSQTANTGTGYLGNTAALDRSFDGLLDEVRLYRRPLSVEEITVLSFGPPANVAPAVDAGPDLIAAAGVPLQLLGAVSDDDRPNAPGGLEIQWERLSGPGAVSFVGLGPQPGAIFSGGGVYVLRLTANDGAVTTADDVVVDVTGPTLVSIRPYSGEPTLTEWPKRDKWVQVSRSDNFAAPLDVHLEISGTATNGFDYALVSNRVVIPAGMMNAEFLVTPVADAMAEGDETIQLGILPDPNYALAPTNRLMLTLRDTPWDQWRFDHFTAEELGIPNFSGDLADPDGDGKVNVYEYAVGTPPLLPDTVPGLWASIVTGTNGLATNLITIQRLEGSPDISYALEATSDFVLWVSGFQLFILQSTGPASNGVQFWHYRMTSALNPGFVRLRVNRLSAPPP